MTSTNQTDRTNDDLTVIEIKGPDARSFLQGQLTCDVDELHGELLQHLTGAHCDSKGRIISSFQICKSFGQPEGEDAYLLRMDKDLTAIAIEHLKKYALFSKVAIDISQHQSSFHRLHTKEGGKLGFTHRQAIYSKEGVSLVYWTDRGWIVESIGSPLFIEAVQKRYEAEEIDYAFFLQSLAMQSLIYCTADMSGKWLPHDLAYQRINAISFKKGCFIGQEIIARMHYKATTQKGIGIAVVNHSNAASIKSEALEFSDGKLIRSLTRGSTLLALLSFRKSLPEAIGIKIEDDTIRASIFPPMPPN